MGTDRATISSNLASGLELFFRRLDLELGFDRIQ